MSNDRHFQRGNADLEINLAEQTNFFGFANRVKNAFREGITCFRFRVGKMVSPVALRPEIHDENDAIALAQDIWADYRDMEHGRLGA